MEQRSRTQIPAELKAAAFEDSFAGKIVVGLSNDTNFLRPITSGQLNQTAQPRRRGGDALAVGGSVGRGRRMTVCDLDGQHRRGRNASRAVGHDPSVGERIGP
jgi:acyl-coenzyme A thioesterase PaaI-like protein